MSDFYNLRQPAQEIGNQLQSNTAIVDELKKSLGPVKDELDKLNISAVRFKASMQLEKELRSLYELGQKTGATATQLEAIKEKWKQAKDQVKEFESVLNKLSPSQIKTLGIEQEALALKTSKVIKLVKETKDEYGKLKESNIIVMGLDKSAKMLANSLKTVGSSILGILKLSGGLGGALSFLRDAYGAAKKLGAEYHNIAINTGAIGTANRKAFDQGLYNSVYKGVERLRDEFGYTREEAMSMMQTIGKAGVGVPMTPQTFAQLRTLTGLMQRVANISPEMTMKVAYDGMRRFGFGVDKVAGQLLVVSEHAQSSGMSFDDWSNSVFAINKEFEDYGYTVAEVSSALHTVYNSSFMAHRGFKMTKDQADELTRTLLKLSTGADMSAEGFAGIVQNMSGFQGKDILKSMHEVKRGLMSGNQDVAVNFARSLEGMIDKAIPGEKDFYRIKQFFETLGVTVKDSFAVDYAEALNTNDLKKQAQTVIEGVLGLGGKMRKDQGKADDTSLDDIQADAVVKQMIIEFKDKGLDKIEDFMQRLFNVAMDQSLKLEVFIENLMTNIGNIGKMMDDWVRGATGINTNIQGILNSIGQFVGKLDVAKMGAGLPVAAAAGGAILSGTGAALGFGAKKLLTGMSKVDVGKAAKNVLGKGGGMTPGVGGPTSALGGATSALGGATQVPAHIAAQHLALTKAIKGNALWTAGISGLENTREAIIKTQEGEDPFWSGVNALGKTAGTTLGSIYGGAKGALWGARLGPKGAFAGAFAGSTAGAAAADYSMSQLESYYRQAGLGALNQDQTDQALGLGDINSRTTREIATKRDKEFRAKGVDEKLLLRAQRGDTNALKAITKQMRDDAEKSKGSTVGIQQAIGNAAVNIQQVEGVFKANLDDASKKMNTKIKDMDFPGVMQSIANRFSEWSGGLKRLLSIEGIAEAATLGPGMRTSIFGGNQSIVTPVKLGRGVKSSGYEADSGLDIHAPPGTPVYSALSGRIVYSERGHTPWASGKDTPNSVLVELDKPFMEAGKLIKYAFYTHLQSLTREVVDEARTGKKNNTRVEAGQQIGTVGYGNQVPHLHFGLLGDRAQSSFLNYRQINDLLGLQSGKEIDLTHTHGKEHIKNNVNIYVQGKDEANHIHQNLPGAPPVPAVLLES